MTSARGSHRARILRSISSATVRKAIAVAPVNPFSVRIVRPIAELALRLAGPTLPGTETVQIDDGTVHGEVVLGPKVDRGAEGVILYIHGGGFIVGSPRGYRGATSRLSTATRLPVFAVDYRKAPEHPFPAAPHDVSTAYRWLLGKGYRPDQIIVAGDSAGGYLAAELVITNAFNRFKPPAGLVLFSPMADLALEIGHATPHSDGLLSVPAARAAVAMYTDRPRSLALRSGLSLPPTMIHASSREFFTADALSLADQFRAVGALCDLKLWPDQMHIFHVLPLLIPESRKVYRAAAQFVDSVLKPPAAAAV